MSLRYRNQDIVETVGQQPSLEDFVNDLKKQKNNLDIYTQQSIEAEQATLGSVMLTSGDLMKSIGHMLDFSDFSMLEHRLIWRAFLKMSEQNMDMDIITVSEFLMQYPYKGQTSCLEMAGGLAYLSLLVEHTPSSANVMAYLTIVKDRSNRRELNAVADKIREMTKVGSGHGTKDTLYFAQERLQVLSKTIEGKTDEQRSAKQLAAQLIEHIDDVINDRIPARITSGFEDIDEEMNGGFDCGTLNIIAGRTSMGKTVLAQNFATHMSDQDDIIFFSLEMSEQQMSSRMVSALGLVEHSKVQNPKRINEEDWPKINNGMFKLSELKLHTFFGRKNVLQIAGISREIAQEHAVKAVFIDHLQEIKPTDTDQTLYRADQVSNMVSSLKALALELNCPVFLACQINREAIKNSSSRPNLTNLRDSGAVEEKADTVIAIHRPEMYKTNPDQDSDDDGIAEIIFLKNRNSGKAGGVVRLSSATLDTMRFTSLTRYDDSDLGGWHE